MGVEQGGSTVGVFDINGFQFLFGFPSRSLIEQVELGKWNLQQANLETSWWSPTLGCVDERVKLDWSWVKILGLLLNLWTPDVMKGIGEYRGGWIEMEEESTLRNHLRWARIRVKGVPESIPRRMEIEHGGFYYTLTLWVETPARVRRCSPETAEEKARPCRPYTDDAMR